MIEKNEHNEIHDEIIRYFDLADSVISAVENENNNANMNIELQLVLIEPLIQEVQKSADVLSDSFLAYVERDGVVTNEMSSAIETAIRAIFNALVQFIDEVKNIPTDLANKKPKQLMDSSRKYKYAKIIEKLLQNIELLRNGPNQKELRRQQERLPDFAHIISAVDDLGFHNMVMGRAMNAIGIIKKIEMVEPGASLTGLNPGEPDRKQKFTEMLSKAQQVSQRQHKLD